MTRPACLSTGAESWLGGEGGVDDFQKLNARMGDCSSLAAMFVVRR